MYARVVANYIRSAYISRGTVRERLIAPLWFHNPLSRPFWPPVFSRRKDSRASDTQVLAPRNANVTPSMFTPVKYIPFQK